MDIAEWLQGLGLGQYAPAFAENAIHWDVLPKLTVDDLKEIGVAAVGDRRRLLEAIASLGSCALPAASTAVPSAVFGEAERRQLTVMFCDLVGSTSLSVRFDPEDLREVIGTYHRSVNETVARFSGFVAKYMGDGVLVYFGYPQAHEDDAERAVGAGLALIDRVAALDVPEPLQVRLGIASGLVVVGDLIGEGAAQERGVVGETANLAARLQGLAEPGTLVVADSTRRQLGALFDVEDLGTRSLAGFVESQRAWRVFGESGIVSRFEALRSEAAPLIGRDEELALLLRRWEQAEAGEGRVVLLSGEPGIGKSRLTEALSQRIAGEPHTRLRHFCSPRHQDSALHPFIVQLERAAGFAHSDMVAEKLGKLRALLAPGARRDDEIELLAELLSLPNSAADLALSPQRKRERLFEALLHQLEALARSRPVLMVFEDAHWIDPSSRELLDLTLDRVARLPVLIIVTFRPEFQHAWGGQPHVTTLALNRLGGREGAALVEELAGNAGLAREIIDEIVTRADGVPLFVEELTKAVLESGKGGNRVAAVLAASPLPGSAIPAALHASLIARFDRLGPLAKEVAQIGAMLGREFGYDLIEQVVQRPAAELRLGLDRLAEAGLLFCRGMQPHSFYLFKHALVQDAAYGTLLRTKRQELHARAAAALERHFANLVERQPELLAHHFTQSGMLSEAVEFWIKAGDLARRRSAYAESAAHLRKGLELIPALSQTDLRVRRELEIQLALGDVLMPTKGYASAEAIAAMERAGELCRQVEEPEVKMRTLIGLRTVSHIQGNYLAARRYGTECLEIASRQETRGLAVEARAGLAHTLVVMGSFAETRDRVADVLTGYDADFYHARLPVLGVDPRMIGLAVMGWNEWFLGYPDCAAEAAAESVRQARGFNQPLTLAQALTSAAYAHLLRREAGLAMARLDEALVISRELKFHIRTVEARSLRAWALLTAGDHRSSVRELVEALDQRRAMRNRSWETLYLAVLADAYRCSGAIAEGVSAIHEAHEWAKLRHEHWWHAELHRLEGDLSIAAAEPQGAEQSYWKALATAREQQAKSWELRAATSLARLWGEQGRRSEACDLLAPVYSWFTEGFDTADLKEAAALLSELA